ncbi:hypothetical protein EX30DRAFT_188069 [Ascodesmis nigricans]|uniref:Uncharacterized protein n=1 Tax=Ascodesmis nigricans TaxID=341454 RepID=A0A4S2N0M3_9PEZI|nr:hypothetical protein EX30DRAFT_188069 [Ascodesmis nigricans]
MVVRSACPLERIGDRPDTHCHLCLHYGHDSRYNSCPVQIVRQIFHNPTAHGVAKARGLLDEQLRKAFYWQDAVPHGLKHDTSNIADLFQMYQDHKKAHEDKQMDLVSGRDQKRQKMLHIVPESQAEKPYMCSDIFTGDGGWDSQAHTSSFAHGQNHKELHPSYHPPTPHYASSPPTQFGFSSSVGPQTPQMQATPPVSATLAPQPVDGTIIDHTKLRGDQFARIFPYVVNDGKNYGGLVVNFSAMPVQLVLELMPCVMNCPDIGA